MNVPSRHYVDRLTLVLILVGSAGCGSRDGNPNSTIAYVSRDGTINHIRLMQVDDSGAGSNSQRLTGDAESEDYISWSPNGKRIAYQRAFSGSAIYVINSDGTGERRLSPIPSMDVTPSWSPDGTQIIYARLYTAPQPNNPPMTDIRIMNADGTGDHAILSGTRFSVEPRWSLKNKISFISLMGGSNLNVYTMNPDGTGFIQLTYDGNNGEPTWSPDGSMITFGSDREGGSRLNIFAMNADGSNQVQLTHFDAPIEVGDTNWSSDGKKITFEYDISGMKQSDPNAFAEVWTMNSDGDGAISTAVQCADVGCSPRWRPN